MSSQTKTLNPDDCSCRGERVVNNLESFIQGSEVNMELQAVGEVSKTRGQTYESYNTITLMLETRIAQVRHVSFQNLNNAYLNGLSSASTERGLQFWKPPTLGCLHHRVSRFICAKPETPSPNQEPHPCVGFGTEELWGSWGCRQNTKRLFIK